MASSYNQLLIAILLGRIVPFFLILGKPTRTHRIGVLFEA
ncbi:hypothetical protein D348_01902 [Enterococcus faecalis SLO2C-1]|nr:hypothetical protein D348_01902 [Enterococcus faecalis SLO2C-1]